MVQTVKTWHYNDADETCVNEDTVGFDGTRLVLRKSPKAFYSMMPVHRLDEGTNIHTWKGDGKDAVFGMTPPAIKAGPHAINDNRYVGVVIYRDIGGGDMRDTVFVFDHLGVQKMLYNMLSSVVIDGLVIGTTYVVVHTTANKLYFIKIVDASLVKQIDAVSPIATGSKFLCSTLGNWVCYGVSISGGTVYLHSLSATGFQAIGWGSTSASTWKGGFAFYSVLGEAVTREFSPGTSVSHTVAADRYNVSVWSLVTTALPCAVSPCGGYFCATTTTAIKRWIHETPDTMIALADKTIPAPWNVGNTKCDISWYGRFVAILFSTTPKQTAIFPIAKAAPFCGKDNPEEIEPLITTPAP